LAIGLSLFPAKVPAPTIKYEFKNHLIYIQGNSLKAEASLFVEPSFIVLGAIKEKEEEKENILLDKIIYCESKGNYRAQNPNSTAFGLCQMLESTRNYIEEKWQMKIDWQNPEQQYYACQRLLKEEGVIHWLETKNCWSK